MTDSNPIEASILTALESGSKTLGELKDFTQCGSDPVLNTALQHLQSERRIEYSFESGVLEYRLIPPEQKGARPFFLAWQRGEPRTFLGLSENK